MKKVIKFFGEIINFILENPKKATYENGILTVWYSDTKIVKYKGDSTVWYKLPLMKRCGVGDEETLCEVMEYIKEYGNPYPTAHLKNEKEIVK